MKKNNLFLMAALLTAGALASCVNDNFDEQTAQNSGKEIVFSTSTMTRATPVTAATEIVDFKVWAFESDNNALINGVKYEQTAAGATTYKTANTHYWPASGDLTFFAISPETVTGLDNVSVTNTAQSFDYAAPTSLTDQADLMFGTPETNSVSNGTDVNIKFNHLLSQVSFEAKTASTNLEVEIKEVTICNVKTTATYTNGTGWGTPTADKADYSIGLNTANTTFSTTTVKEITAGDGVLLLVPQEITAWNTNKTTPKAITAADAAGEAYVKVKAVIKNVTNPSSPVTIFDEKDASDEFTGNGAYIYLPISAPAADSNAWVAGHSYKYTMTFGDTATGQSGTGIGFDENGTPQNLGATAVTITTSIVDWTTVTPPDLVF